MLEIIEARRAEDFEAARRLCWAYRDVLLSLGGRDAEAVLFYYGEDTYGAMMEDLARYHAPPTGAILLMRQDGDAVGCGMFHEFAPGVAEIKRVYLDPALRGQGAGRAMMEALIETVRARGYRRILMDTGRKLEAAIALYDRLGFRRIDAYHDIPPDLADIMVFFEMKLQAEG